MTNRAADQLIRAWFETRTEGTLYLPDGCFGRPMDNLHRLSFVGTLSDRLLVELDGQLLLVFTPAALVKVQAGALVLSGFKQLVFDWQEYGSKVPHVSIYKAGEVRIEPSPL